MKRNFYISKKFVKTSTKIYVSEIWCNLPGEVYHSQIETNPTILSGVKCCLKILFDSNIVLLMKFDVSELVASVFFLYERGSLAGIKDDLTASEARRRQPFICLRNDSNGILLCDFLYKRAIVFSE